MLPAHKTSVIGQPCALQQPAVGGSIEVPGYNDAGVQTECLLDGRVPRQRRSPLCCVHGRMGSTSRVEVTEVNATCAVYLRHCRGLSWVWMDPIIPIGNGRVQLPEV